MPPVGGSGEQPGRGQLPHRRQHRVRVQAGDLAEQPSVNGRPATASALSTARASAPHRAARATSSSANRRRQRHRLRQLARVGDGGGHQLLGEERMPLRPRVHLLHQLRRWRCPHQRGDLLGHLLRDSGPSRISSTPASRRTWVSQSATAASSGTSSLRQVTTTVTASPRPARTR